MIQTAANQLKKYPPVYRMAVGLGLTAAILSILGRYVVYYLYLHPLRNIPGPPVDWIPLTGNMRTILRRGASGIRKKKGSLKGMIARAALQWARQYGGLVVYRGLWNKPRLLVTDPELVKQILTVDAYDFIKPKSISRFLTPVLGEGLIIAEGSTHRNQRKILNPAFSVQALRGLAPIMAKPAWALRRQWLQAMDSDPSGAPAVNVSAKLNLVTLDIIGLAAFGEDFCLVEDAQSNRLGQAYLDVCLGDKLIHRVLGVLFPLYRKLPFRAIRIVERGIVSLDEETRAIVLNNLGKTNGDNLLRRMAREIDPETGESLSVKELQAQCLTFMAAGHETAGTALSWCLWFLARHKDIQTALRTEVRSLSLDDDEVPSYDAINRLNLLNNVCREALRLIPPVPITYRVARKDTILGGHVVSKDSFIAVSPLVSHLSPEFWGEDADRFRPSRWDEAPANNVSPYVYMPFLAGPRQCIGSKFAMMEMKMVLCIVLKDLLFSEKPNFHPQKKHVLVTRPSPNMTLVVQRA